MINILSYIDPGSTALVWQILAGVLIAFGVVLGIWWTKITTFFKGIWTKLFGKNKNKGNADDASSEVLDESENDSADNAKNESADKAPDKAEDEI